MFDVDVGAVTAELGESGVVQEHHDDVGGTVVRMRSLVEVRLRFGHGTADPTFER